MNLERSAGVLLHPTSLAGRHGIGTLGDEAERWLEWLQLTGCAVWQVLPLGPTGFGDSPYQSFSSFAGNALLIDLDRLVDDGLLRPEEVAAPRPGRADRVDFGSLIPWKSRLLDLVRDRLTEPHPLRAEFDKFADTHSAWLDDYTLFRALKDTFGGRPWHEWPPDVRDRRPAALAAARRELANSVQRYAVRQWLFFRQWAEIRAAAHRRGVTIFGDIPLYVAQDAADVWANRSLFELAPDGSSLEVAGVPPDYFSETGQLWGNPIYRWQAHERTGYRWWIERVKATLRVVDVVRIDHFRGFADYWAIPADARTAETGEWRTGPGRAVFDALAAELGELPVIAEDLGDLSPAVHELRDELGLPGMKIVQFAFDGDPDNPFLPEHVERRSVVYTGTHDNDTTIGWYASAGAMERREVRRRVGRAPAGINWTLMELAWNTKSFLAIAPMQDLLDLGASERMNTPGRPGGNWRWRMLPDALTPELAQRLRVLNASTGRLRDDANAVADTG